MWRLLEMYRHTEYPAASTFNLKKKTGSTFIRKFVTLHQTVRRHIPDDMIFIAKARFCSRSSNDGLQKA